MAIHLTEQGYHAGRRLCSAPRTDGERNVHAAHAPLDNVMFRSDVCTACLLAYAREAYEEGDDMPDYIKRLRRGLFGVGDS